MANKQELAYRAVEADDVSLAVLEMLRTVNAVRTISTPNIGEIAIITTAINELIAQLRRVSDSMKAMMEDSGRASMEETLTRGLTNINSQQAEIIKLLKNVGNSSNATVVAEQKKINNAPLVAGKQINTESKPQPKSEVKAAAPLYKDYLVLGAVGVISLIAGIVLRGFLHF